MIGNEHTDLNVRTEANGSSTVIHTTKNYSNQAFIILDSSQGNFYKVQSDAALTTNRTTVSDAGNYDFSSMYAYVSSGYVKNVLTGSGNSGGSGESGGNENKPDNSLGSGAIAVPTELAGAIEYSAHVREMWMSESDENRRMAKQIHALYLATDTVNVMKKVDTEKALLKVKSRMSGNRHKGTMWWQWAQRAAAILFIPLLVTLMLQYWGGNEQELAQIIEVKTNPGMMTSLTLPDGTLVYLNSESTLSYPSRFDNDTRNVTLQGEAYFEVAKNPEKKFIVSTFHQSQIEVLGTHFNVEAYEKDDKVQTTLVEGRVGFISTQDNMSKKVLMKPGQKLVYDLKDSKVQLYTTSGESEIAWKEGKIIFKDTPLEESLRMLEKRL